MASTTGQVALSTSGALVVAGDQNAPTVVQVVNIDAAITEYLGFTSAVTSGTGMQLLKGERLTVWLDAGESLYAVAASGTPTIDFLKSRNVQRGS